MYLSNTLKPEPPNAESSVRPRGLPRPSAIQLRLPAKTLNLEHFHNCSTTQKHVYTYTHTHTHIHTYTHTHMHTCTHTHIQQKTLIDTQK